jgi:hypothetical protein
MRAKIWLSLAVGWISLSLIGASGATVASTSTVSGPPRVPGAGRGVYLGAWVNPEKRSEKSCPKKQRYAGCQEFAQLPTFIKQVGKVAILHVYAGWSDAAPVKSLRVISHRFGAIPLLDWACGDSDRRISAGDDDPLIFAYAKALKSYGKPLFLRWFWEMNLLSKSHARCTSLSSDYVAAWQHIWRIFHGKLASRYACNPVAPPISRQTCTINVKNAAFVWCPSGDKKNYPSYYPGNSYVDWIAADGYSRGEHGSPSFFKLFDPFYSWAQMQDPAAPVMIAETGSGNKATGTTKGNVQASYLQGAATAIVKPITPIIKPSRMPAVQAFVYFDSKGNDGSWDLEGAGLAAFRALRNQFTFGRR